MKAFGRVLTGALGGMAVAVAFAFPANAAINFDPSSGPSSGGTVSTFVPSGVKFLKVLAGSDHMIALGDDGKAYAWGVGTSGQVGDGSGADAGYPTPVVMPEGVTFIDIAVGDGTTLAFGDDGNTYAWGDNNGGQVGDGTTSDGLAPARVAVPDGVKFVTVATGDILSLAIGDDGNTYSWGLNNNGQLGYGNNSASAFPARVATPADIAFTSVSAGDRHSLALTAEGLAFAWGKNDDGQLGTGNTGNENVPVPVTMPAGVMFTSISAGKDFSVALGSDGAAYAWGSGSSGELGAGTTSGATVPTRVSMPDGVTFTSIDAGDAFVLAQGNDGNLYGWGNNEGGQLGDGSKANSSVPVRVAVPDGVRYTAFSAGGWKSSVAIGDDGHTYAWGFGKRGRLGNGDSPDATGPVLVTGVTVNEVRYGNLPGTAITALENDVWSATSPSATCGAVDVTTLWTQFNRPTSESMSTQFTYLPAVSPAITAQPVGTEAARGTSVTLAIEYVGDPEPQLRWESSTDGENWIPLADEDSAALTLSVTDKTNYRVVVSACGVSLYSDVATISSESDPAVDPSVDPAEEPAAKAELLPQSGSGDLAVTGSNGATLVPVALIALVALLGGGVLLSLARRRSAERAR